MREGGFRRGQGETSTPVREVARSLGVKRTGPVVRYGDLPANLRKAERPKRRGGLPAAVNRTGSVLEEDNVMRKHFSALVLFCCSNVALAADPCMDLNGHPMSIVANNYQGVTGEINFFKNTQSFATTIKFTGQSPDAMAGTCYNGHIIFTRTHPGPGGFVQTYDGSSTDFAFGVIKGTYSNGKISHPWHGIVLTFSGGSGSSPGPKPTSTPAQIAACQQQCVDDLAVEKSPGDGVVICKKACLDCKSKCH